MTQGAERPNFSRRWLGALPFLALAQAQSASGRPREVSRFGQVNRIVAKAGAVPDLCREFSSFSSGEVKGCELYSTSLDLTNDITIWTFEIWTKEADHAAAVLSPVVQASIERCKLLIDKFEQIASFHLD